MERRAKLTGIAFGAALALSLCTLQMGLAVDDWAQVLRARGQLPHFGGNSWDLYRFTGGSPEAFERMIHDGPYPWWTYRGMRVGFFRPLSSALIHFDVELLGDHVWLWHLHSIAWYLALLAVVLVLYRRVLPEGTAELALLFFAIDDAHWMPAGWLANRNALVAAVPAVGGLLLHLRWREQGWKPGLPLSVLAYAVALTGGESALGALGYVGTYELLNVRRESLRARALALLPLFGVVLAWAITYRALGYGAHGSAIYIDPLAEPLQYLEVAPGRLLALLGSLTLGVSSDLWMFLSRGRFVLGAVGVLGISLFALWLRRARGAWTDDQWARLRWLIVSGLLALIPVASTFPADRLLLMPTIGSAAVVGCLLHALWKERGGLARSAKVMLIAAHGVFALPAWVMNPFFFSVVGGYVERAVNHEDLDSKRLEGRVVVLAGPDPVSALYGGFSRLLQGLPPAKSWVALSYAPYDHRLTRVAENAVELEVIGGSMLETTMEQLMRHPRFPLEPGYTSKQSGVTVTVLEATEGRPKKIRADFTDEVELIVWKDLRARHFTLPPVGQSVELKHDDTPFDAISKLLR